MLIFPNRTNGAVCHNNKRSLNYTAASEQVQTIHDLLHEYRLYREISARPQADRLERPKYGQAMSLSGGSGSSVGIATDYGLDGPGIETRWGRDFPHVQTGPGAHPASCTMGTGSFPGVKCSRGVLLTTHPLLAPRSWKSRANTSTPLWATTGPVTGLLYLY